MDRRETAGVTTRLIVDYVRAHAGDAGVQRLLALAGEQRPLAELEDEGTWSTYDAKIRLFEAAEEVLGDPRVAVRIGEHVIDSRVGRPIRLVLTLLGSPEQVLRNIARTVPKFSTAATMRAIESDHDRATVTYRLRSGHRPHRHDCGYNVGLLAQVPVLFDLPPATVTEERCQVDGAQECRYRIRWRAASRRRRLLRLLRGGASTSRLEMDELREQLDTIQRTVADLVSMEDVDELLATIATRASTTVRAQAYLLAVRLDDGRPQRVHADGFDRATAEELGDRLLDGEQLDDLDASVLTAEVRSARRSYGELAAFFPVDQDFFASDGELLAAYARLAAASLDSVTGLTAARSRRETAEALLELATELAHAQTTASAARSVASLTPRVTGADRAVVFRWDREGRRLAALAAHGWPAGLRQALLDLSVAESDTPELVRMLTAPEVRVYTDDDPDGFIRATLKSFETSTIAVAPMLGTEGFDGVLVAAWTVEDAAGVVRHDLLDRLGGLAAQAETALSRARLLETATHRATHDALTDLPNRILFEERIDGALARWRREDRRFAVGFADIDGFKAVNDRWGHATGDALLREIADRLRTAVRDTDAVARASGDEFVLLFDQVGDTDSAGRVAEKVLAGVNRPADVDGRPLGVSLSLGLALAPRDGTSAVDLLRHADHAMYAAKAAGTGRWAIYEPDESSKRLNT